MANLGTTSANLLGVLGSGTSVATVAEIAQEVELTTDATRSALYRLIDKGFVRVRTDKNTGMRVYSRTAAGTKALKRA